MVNTTFRTDFANKDIREITAAPGQQFGTMSWSESSSMLAYMSQNDFIFEDQLEQAKVDNWNIFVIDREGNTRLALEGAAHPAWMPDGTKLLYLKSDGLYLYDIPAASEVRILQMNAAEGNVGVLTSTMFDISPDGAHLILTTQGRGMIEVFDIIPEPFDVTFVGRITSETESYSWPVISPDSQTYAVLVRNIDSNNGSVPRIEFRSILGRKVLLSYELKEFAPQTVILDDWIARPIELE